MATSLKNLSQHTQENIQDISDKTFALVVAEWNDEITSSLYSGAVETLLGYGAKKRIYIERTFPDPLSCL